MPQQYSSGSDTRVFLLADVQEFLALDPKLKVVLFKLPSSPIPTFSDDDSDVDGSGHFYPIAYGETMFRMKLAGNVTIGLAFTDPSDVPCDFSLSDAQPELLLYGTIGGPFSGTKRGAEIGCYGSYSGIQDQGQRQSEQVFGSHFRQSGVQSTRFPHHIPTTEPIPGSIYLSYAPLENATEVSIFNDRDNGRCRGLLLSYENKAQRALGDCWLGIDDEESYAEPSHICFRNTFNIPRPFDDIHFNALRVVASYPDHTHDENDWVCWTLSGTIEFWFTDKAASLTRTVTSQ
ncbi:hypothetical protein PspLS_03481 [Pyricularia sp. CBS 133598]|nr:hypothetical protein PspLS_03481 [Pyricularia sp. CBS 133598]